MKIADRTFKTFKTFKPLKLLADLFVSEFRLLPDAYQVSVWQNLRIETPEQFQGLRFAVFIVNRVYWDVLIVQLLWRWNFRLL